MNKYTSQNKGYSAGIKKIKLAPLKSNFISNFFLRFKKNGTTV